MAVAQWVLGHPSTAERTTNEVLDYALAAGDSDSLAYAYTNSSIRAIDIVEDWGTLLERAEKGIELFQKLGSIYLQTYCTFWRARALSELGDIKDAARLTDEGMTIIDKISIGYHRATCIAKYAKMLAMSGQKDREQGMVEKAPVLVLSSGEYSQEPEVMVLTGDYHMLCGDTDQALQACRAAMRIAVPREEVSWKLRVSLKTAKVFSENKKVSQASDLLLPVFERYPDKVGKGDPQTARAFLEAL